jgi:2-polyprenyl-3-methyl-5-hydroxy-6-metoxy-1,4-benzoquinol methylase
MLSPLMSADKRENVAERADPTATPAHILQEHAARYVFAAQYCRGKDVLDAASGMGYGTDFLRLQGARATGLELDEQAVSYCDAQYPLTTYIQGTAEKMPESWTESFDVVVSFETIEHLPNPKKFIAEVHRCLRPSGLFICSTPNKGLTVLQGANTHHIKEFYRKEFVRFLSTLFEAREILGQSFHSPAYAGVSILHTLVRKILRALGIPPLGITDSFANQACQSPFDRTSIAADRVSATVKPSVIHRMKIPAFVIVVAEKRPK